LDEAELSRREEMLLLAAAKILPTMHTVGKPSFGRRQLRQNDQHHPIEVFVNAPRV
jgi:hypothetical protein